MLDRFAFSGTPEHVAALARRVLDAGAGRVDFGAPHGLTDGDGVALLGTCGAAAATLTWWRSWSTT